jgi:Ni,Fe-hydrogenase I large subunit
MARLVIDPVTRIGGHLRIEASVSSQTVVDAWSSGTMFRGVELVLHGRDPRDAWMFAARICGMCSGVHSLGSVRAVENALRISIPTNARLIRNLLAGTQFVQDHIVQFYQLQSFDWVDVAAALTADPAATAALATAQSDHPLSSVDYFRGVQSRLQAVQASGQLGLFAQGYWGHPAYALSPAQDLLLVAHYFEALDWQRTLMRIHTLLGGISPHGATYLVGGMTVVPPWGGPVRASSGEHPQQVDRKSPDALSRTGLADIGDIIDLTQRFVDEVYVPDVALLARAYPEWMAIGRGRANFLSYGEFPEDDAGNAWLMPAGRVMDGDLTAALPIDQSGVAETVVHSWYASEGDPAALTPPTEGETVPQYAGPALPFTTLEGADRYSWLKAPRYQDDAMEVGPAARLLVAYAAGPGDIRSRVDAAAADLGGDPAALASTLGRTVARSIEVQLLVGRFTDWLRQLQANLALGDLAVADITKWDPASWPSSAAGHSLGEGPRGAVGHWMSIAGGHVDAYQIVDASTWNASPRDGQGRRGALEEALVGTPVSDPDRPLEILRVVHAFDPCTACAVHALDPTDRGPIGIRVNHGGAR